MAAVSLDGVMADINKAMKSTVLVRGGLQPRQRASTGSLVQDLMLGGGWPLACWNELIGLESSGKTTIAHKTVVAAQLLDPDHVTLWCAAEEYDMEYSKVLGVDNDRIIFCHSNIMEEVYEIMIRLLESKQVNAVVLDSYPALSPKAEVEKDMDEMTVGLGAKLTNLFMRKSVPIIGKAPVLGLIINQWRDQINTNGDPRTTPGGKGKNYAYISRVEAARESWIIVGDSPVGQVIKTRTIKNKSAAPRKLATVNYFFADTTYKGVEYKMGQYDTISQVFNTAIDLDVIKRSGANYSFATYSWKGGGGTPGRDKILESLYEDPELVELMDQHVRATVFGTPLPTARKRTRRRST